MKNRLVRIGGLSVFLLSIFFLVGLVSAAISNTETDFNIEGCSFNLAGTYIGVSPGKCSSGIAEGYFYCGTDLTPFVTFDAPGRAGDPRGCSLGADNYTNGDVFCCPSGMRCDPTSLLCEVRVDNCFNQGTQLDCENNGCLWFDVTGECAQSASDKSCSYYDTEVSCIGDIWNLGTTGVGAELCGEYVECGGEIFSISEGNCGCIWDNTASAGNECKFKMTASESFYLGTQDRFECSNVYDLGNCIDGKQNVSWNSTVNIISGFNGTVPQECLNVLGCDGGEGERFCGEPIISLPGFSLFSLLVSLLLIISYYFLSDRFKYNRDVELS